MSPAAVSCVVMAAAPLAIVARARLTRCHSTHTGVRCALDTGHTVATPHRWRDRAWWDFETCPDEVDHA